MYEVRREFKYLIVGLCILLREHPPISQSKPPYATNIPRARPHCAPLQHVSAPIGDHPQVKCTQKKNIFIVTTVYVNGSVESTI
jgi:hypothetical protein